MRNSDTLTGETNAITVWIAKLGALRTRVARSIAADEAFGRLLMNSSWVLGGNVAFICIGAAQGIVVAHALGVEQFGILTLVITFVTVVTRLTAFRMDEFIVKYVTEALADDCKERVAAIIKTSVIVEVATSFVTFLFVLMVAAIASDWFLPAPGSGALISMYAVVVLVNVVGETTFGLMQVLNQFRLNSILRTAGKAVSFILVIVATLWWPGTVGILLAYIGGSLITAVFLVVAVVRTINRRLEKRWWCVPLRTLRESRRPMIEFILSTNISGTLSVLIREGDPLLLGYFCNPTAVGYFKVARSLVALVMAPVVPLSQTIYREVAHTVAQQDWVQMRRLLRKTTWVSSAYVFPASLLFAASSVWLIAFLYGQQFIPAAPALWILLAGLAFDQVFSWARRALLALGRADFPPKVEGLLAILKVGGAIVLLPAYSYLGNAALMSVLAVVGAYLLTRKVYKEMAERAHKIAGIGRIGGVA